MLWSAVQDILKQKLIWFESQEYTLCFSCFFNSLFPNPKTERKRAEIWLINVSTGYNKYVQDNAVSSQHFHGNYFQIDMQAKLLEYEPMRRTLSLKLSNHIEAQSF